MKYAFIDVETTGLEIGTDRIIQVAAVLEGGGATFAKLVNPLRPVPREALEITGLDPAEIGQAQPWSVVGPEFVSFVAGRTLVGYNIAAFDLPIIRAELGRIGADAEAIPYETPVFDLLQWWRHFDGYSLENAIRRYTELDADNIDFHDALGDTQPLEALMRGMRVRFGLLERRFQEINKLVTADFATPDGKLRYDDEGEVIYNFGKHKGKRVRDQPSYGDWVIGNVKNPHVVRVVSHITQQGQAWRNKAATQSRRSTPSR